MAHGPLPTGAELLFEVAPPSHPGPYRWIVRKITCKLAQVDVRENTPKQRWREEEFGFAVLQNSHGEEK